jgi:gliding motility-associated-like protein
MKNLYFLLFALFTINNAHTQCEINIAEDQLICTTTYSAQLAPSPLGGFWTYECEDGDGLVEMTDFGGGAVRFVFSECGIYKLVYHFEIPGICENTDTLTLYVEDPSTRQITNNTDTGLTYGPINCHQGAIVPCEYAVTIGGEDPPVPEWEICTMSTCATAIYTPEATPDPDDSCAALDIDVTTSGVTTSTTSCWSGTQDAFLDVALESGDVIDNDFLEFLDSLVLDNFLDIGQGCEIPSKCFVPDASCIDSITYDSLYLEIPVHLGGNWNYLSMEAGLDTLQLMDSTIIILNGQEYLFVIDPGADYYGSEDIEFSIFRWINDTPFPAEGYLEMQLLWTENWTFDSLLTLDPTVHYKDSLACETCNGSFNVSLFDIPEIPEYPCGPITIGMGGGCECVDMFLQTSGNDIIDCYNPCAILDATGGSNEDFVIFWEDEFGNVFNESNISVCQPGTYIATLLTTESGCTISESFTVFDELDFPFFSFNPSEVSISAQSPCVTLEPDLQDQSFYDYNWSGPNGFSSSDFNPSVCEEGVYTLQVINVFNGCDFSASITVIMETIINQDISQTVCEGTCFNLLGIDYCDEDVYFIIVDEFNTITLDLTVEAQPSLGLIETICQGESIMIGGVTYDETGMYQLSLDAVTGCDTLVDLNLEVLENPTLEIERSLCQNEDIIINGVIYTEAGLYDDVFFSNQSCDTIVTINIVSELSPFLLLEEEICQGDTYTIGGEAFTATGSYDLNLAAVSGCDTIVELELLVLPLNTRSEAITLCSNESIAIGDTLITTPGDYNILLASQEGCDTMLNLFVEEEPFIMAEREVIFCGEDTLQIGNVLIVEEGTYTIIIPSSTSCDTSLMLTVIEPDDIEVEEDLTIEVCGVEDLVIDAGVLSSEENLSYLWSTGETVSSIDISTRGNYFVSISNGCSESVRSIEVINTVTASEERVYEPNIFSPNNDGINDEFMLFAGDPVEAYNLIIYDRWGNQVFSNSNPEIGWNGNYKNNRAAPGTYIWFATFSTRRCDDSLQEIQLSGSVTIVL